MKITSVLPFVIITLLTGCASIQDTASRGNMQLINATYKHWSHVPSAGSDIPERGTDLTMTIGDWPKEYMPLYMVYNKRRTSSAEISQRSDSTVIITGRIIRMSAMLQKKSATVDLSDRLVYKDKKGKTRFIDIDSWQRAQN